MQKIAIFTANGKSLAPMLDLIKSSSGIDLESDRYIIVGCENVPGFDAVANGDPVIYDVVAPGIVDMAKKTLATNPDVKAFLFECTELPQFADDVRAETGLPVYDSITCTNAYMSGLMDNPRFGLNEWQDEAEDAQESRKQHKKGCKHNKKHGRGRKHAHMHRSVEDIVSALHVLLEGQ